MLSPDSLATWRTLRNRELQLPVPSFQDIVRYQTEKQLKQSGASCPQKLQKALDQLHTRNRNFLLARSERLAAHAHWIAADLANCAAELEALGADVSSLSNAALQYESTLKKMQNDVSDAIAQIRASTA